MLHNIHSHGLNIRKSGVGTVWTARGGVETKKVRREIFTHAVAHVILANDRRPAGRRRRSPTLKS